MATLLFPVLPGIFLVLTEFILGQYVERSVRNPGEQRRAGDWLQMPAYGVDQLTDDEIAALAAYIEEMG